jgi:hypothetical protein
MASPHAEPNHDHENPDSQDPVAGSWTATGSMSFSGDAATLLPNGKVLLSGYNGSELYDPATGTWTATGSMNTSRSGHTATLLLNGKVLVAAGNRVSSAEPYDPDSGTWSGTGSLTGDRVSPSPARGSSSGCDHISERETVHSLAISSHASAITNALKAQIGNFASLALTLLALGLGLAAILQQVRARSHCIRWGECCV